MPELMFDTQDAVPEVFRPIAAEKDGKWSINVVPKSEVDEFRTNNLNLARERDSLKSTFGRLQSDVGLEPDKLEDFITSYGELKTIKQQVDDGKLVADSSLEAALESKTGAMKSQFEHQVRELTIRGTSLQSENENLKATIQRNEVNSKVLEAINDPASGALASATKHILREASDIFSLDEHGDLVAKDRKGNIIYGADGSTPMSPKEFLISLEESSPFFFKSSQGGGGGGGGGSGQSLSPAQLAAMSPEQKINYGRANGLAG